MNNTCFESGDQPGITQQPSLVSCFNSGVGVGVIVAVGGGVAVACAVGKALGVSLGALVAAATGPGLAWLHAAITVANTNKIEAYAIVFILPPSSFILTVVDTNRAATDS
jgi:hypothetical protein